MRLAATRSSIAAPGAPRSGGDCAHAGERDQTLNAATAASAGLLSAAPARRMTVNLIVSLIESARQVDPARDPSQGLGPVLASITDRPGGSYFGVSARFRPPAT